IIRADTTASTGSRAVTPSPDPQAFHTELCRFNAPRLSPGRIHPDWERDVRAELDMSAPEGGLGETERAKIQEDAAGAPRDAAAFLGWFEGLRERGPGQGDPLFPWLAASPTSGGMAWCRRP